MEKHKKKQYKTFKNEADKPLAVEIERSGFPVTVGGIEFFFSTSEEHIDAFLRLYEDPQAVEDRIEKLRIEDQKKNAEYKDGIPTREQFMQSIEYKKRALREIYDIVLGEGSFERLYTTYPDINALTGILTKIMELADKGLAQWAEKEKKKQQATQAAALMAKQDRKKGLKHNAIQHIR